MEWGTSETWWGTGPTRPHSGYATDTDAISATTALGPGHKIASLTTVAMNAIKATPNLFSRFVNILEGIDKEIASILRKKCLEHTCRRRRGNESCGEGETASCSVLNSTTAGMYQCIPILMMFSSIHRLLSFCVCGQTQESVSNSTHNMAATTSQ